MRDDRLLALSFGLAILAALCAYYTPFARWRAYRRRRKLKPDCCRRYAMGQTFCDDCPAVYSEKDT